MQEGLRHSPPIKTITFRGDNKNFYKARDEALDRLNQWKKELEMTTGGQVHIYETCPRVDLPWIVVYYSIISATGEPIINQEVVERVLEI